MLQKAFRRAAFGKQQGLEIKTRRLYFVVNNKFFSQKTKIQNE